VKPGGGFDHSRHVRTPSFLGLGGASFDGVGDREIDFLAGERARRLQRRGDGLDGKQIGLQDRACFLATIFQESGDSGGRADAAGVNLGEPEIGLARQFVRFGTRDSLGLGAGQKLDDVRPGVTKLRRRVGRIFARSRHHGGGLFAKAARESYLSGW
jgi:hypothetical protein